MEISYSRQSSIINIKEVRENRITIIGCGSIGSFLGISLAKMGLTKFTLYDFDKVEAHNLPNQFFGLKDIGRNKALATANFMELFNNEVDIRLAGSNGRYDRRLKGSEIVISCVDKMSVRKQIFEDCKKDKGVQLFIDTRMGGFEGQIYFIDMDKKSEIKNYEKTLFSDSSARQLRCTERSILFTVLGITSLVCNEIIKALKDEKIRNYIVIDFSVPQII